MHVRGGGGTHMANEVMCRLRDWSTSPKGRNKESGAFSLEICMSFWLCHTIKSCLVILQYLKSGFISQWLIASQLLIASQA